MTLEDKLAQVLAHAQRRHGTDVVVGLHVQCKQTPTGPSYAVRCYVSKPTRDGLEEIGAARTWPELLR